MCFYNDYDGDWSAEVCDESDADTGPETKCDECERVIAANEWRHTIHQREHEACQICEDDCSDSFIDREDMAGREPDDEDAEWAADQLKILDEHIHDYGEAYSYVRCLGCDKFLRAIEKREEEAGCPKDQRRPQLTMLREDMLEVHEAKEYVEFAVTMFPELAGHPIVVDVLQEVY